MKSDFCQVYDTKPESGISQIRLIAERCQEQGFEKFYEFYRACPERSRRVEGYKIL